jgi:hypothetical protein
MSRHSPLTLKPQCRTLRSHTGPFRIFPWTKRERKSFRNLTGLIMACDASKNGMETMLPPIREGIDVLVSRLPVPVETTLQDNWGCVYYSVLSILSHAVETHYVRNQNQESLGKEVRCRVVTVHGWGVTGKTTTCKMMANDEKCGQWFKHGIFG